MVASETTAASLLRMARRSSGMTQKQVADAAGLTKSMLSAYETGRRQPTFATLVRLMRAAQCELGLAVRAVEQRFPLSGPLGKRVARSRAELSDLARRHGLSKLRVFGSVARG